MTKHEDRRASEGMATSVESRLHPLEPAVGELGEGPDELIAAGKIRERDLVPQGTYVALLVLIGKLRARRESMGLSIADVSERSGLARRTVAGLENGNTANPTIAALYRYALALDVEVTLGVGEIGPDGNSLESA